MFGWSTRQWIWRSGWIGFLAVVLAAGAAAADDDDDGERERRRSPDAALRSALRKAGARPLRERDFAPPDPARVALGRALFFDKELSGNRDVSCATCHHPLAATGDGVSLSAGVGGIGLSTTRVMGEGRERVPRNAPELWNRGLFPTMFWDSRVAENPEHPSGFDTPAGDDLPPGLESTLAAQAMFPVTSAAEMRGEPGENEIADAATNPEIWARLMQRLLAIDAYRKLFAAAYGEPVDELGFEAAANAIAAFEAATWKATGAPFNRYLRGDSNALSVAAKRGARLFFGKAGCGDCHTGALLSDLEHHAIAMPQLGPGKGDGPDGDEDFGRGRETGDAADRYRFRTPSLWNTALNGPWGHAGAYATLEAVMEHHLDPERGLEGYDRRQAQLPLNPNPEEPFSVLDDPGKRGAVADANELARVRLSRRQRKDLLAFLHALTDPGSLDIRADAPARVPSGLPVYD